jgi:hypothetical protein
MAQKEEDDENQKKLVEEFVAVSRNASRTASVAGSRPVSRAGSLDEEREVEMQEQKRKSTYLEVADRSLAPPRPRSRLSSTVSDGSDGSDGSDSSDEHESSSATPHRIV